MSDTVTDSDLQLLARYNRHHAEDAFSEIVRRHLGLVYSAALRQVRSSQLAEEVAQSAFIDLARHAAKFKPDTILTAWLYQVTRRTAIDVVRREARRQLREQIATEMNAMNATTADWTHIEPLLDEAMSALDETDRAAVLLRYFENKSLREVGATLGTSDDAAQKRVSRAVERLREYFAKGGVTVGASGLVVILSANAVQAAPVGLALTISTAAALAGTSIATAFTATAIKTIAMTTIQKTLVTATVAILAGAGIYEARQAAQLRGQNQTLQQQQAPLAEQNNLQTRQIAALREANERLKANTAELIKLRGEVGRLRDSARLLTPDESTAKAWVARATLLMQKLEQMPQWKIPELQFVTEKDWANATWDADLNTEDGVREALSKVREEAENTFLDLMRTAIKKYAAANDGMLPADITQLKSYFDPPVQDAEAMLKRYQLRQTGKLSEDHVKEVARLNEYADEDYDSNHEITLFGGGGGRFNRVKDAVTGAARAFVAANHGQMPSTPSEIEPYLDKPLDAATIQKYLKKFLTEPPPPEVITLEPSLKAYATAHNGQSPNNELELVPYLTTPEQQAAFLKLEGMPPEAVSLAPALQAYTEAHNGQSPKNPSDLLPYLTTPEQQAALQKLEQMKKPASQ